MPGLARHGIDLYLKHESTHPTGSLKHRLARTRFRYALCNGWVRVGSTDEVDGTNIRMDDRRLLLSPSGLTQTPAIGDIVDGDMRIVAIRTVMSGTTVLHYTCQVRG